MNAIKNGWEETDGAPCSGAATSGMDEGHMEQVKSVVEYMHSISCTAVATEVGISPASVYHILPTAWGNHGLCKVDLTHVQQ